PSGNLLELFTWKCSHSLGTHTALSDGAKNEASCDLIVGGLSNDNIVVLSHNKIKAYQFSSYLSHCRIKCLETFGRISRLPHSLLGEIHQANISRHKVSSDGIANN